MGNYDTRRLQERILQILLEFDKMCKAHDLKYCITCGTMIGAVRHKGFIPWDDDIDVAMPRPDYERLIAHSKEWLPEYLEFVCAENDPKYPLPFGKVQDARTTLIERPHLYYLGGCYIDIFPLDAYPDGKLRRWWHYTQYSFFRQCLYLVHRDPYKHGHGMSSWVPLLTRKVFTMDGLQKRIRKLLTRYSYDKAHLAGSYTEGYNKDCPKDVMDTYKPFTFEGQTVQGIADYDTYLTRLYGATYMTPPPPEKQIRHNFYYLDLDHPYREFKSLDK